MPCICERSCGENRTDPDCPECAPRIAAWRAEAKKPKKPAPKFTRQWKGKVRVTKNTRGNGEVFFSAEFRVDGEWFDVKGYTPASGTHNQVEIEFPNAVEAMTEAQRRWTASNDKSIVKKEVVF